MFLDTAPLISRRIALDAVSGISVAGPLSGDADKNDGRNWPFCGTVSAGPTSSGHL
jgi:hypothetical protein